MRKVISSKKSELKPLVPKAAEPKEEVVEEEAKEVTAVGKRVRCVFCQSKTEPAYSDTAALRKYLTDRGKITPKAKNGLCAKHQRRLTTEIKRARHLALLQFTPKVI